MRTALKGIIHGKSIELTQETGLPEGQEVSVEIRPVPGRRPAPAFDPAAPPPQWLERFDVDPAVKLGKFLVKGTRLLADDLEWNRQQRKIGRREIEE